MVAPVLPPVAPGYQRFTLTLGRLQYTGTPTPAVVGPLTEAPLKVIFVGRYIVQAGNVTNYDYFLIYEMTTDKLLIDASGNILADLPDYVNTRTPNFLVIMVPIADLSSDVIAALPATMAI